MTKYVFCNGIQTTHCPEKGRMNYAWIFRQQVNHVLPLAEGKQRLQTNEQKLTM
jgi:hypothetical protein